MVMRTFVVYALVELAVLAALTWYIGLGWTLLVLLATSVVSVALAGSQVKRQLARLQRVRGNPQGAVADGMLVALGTFLVFIGVTVHGIASGSDSSAAWAQWLYIGSAAVVGFLLAYRISLVLADRAGRGQVSRAQEELERVLRR